MVVFQVGAPRGRFECQREFLSNPYFEEIVLQRSSLEAGLLALLRVFRRLDMTKITLYRDGKPQEYTNAHDITISPAGVLTFHWEISEGGSFKKPKAYKFQTSVPFVVEEDVTGG
jgi:hypothetical protein